MVYSYIVVNGATFLVIWASKGKIAPPDYADRELYNAYSDIPVLPKWMRLVYAKITKTEVWEDTDKGKAIMAGYSDTVEVIEEKEDGALEEIPKY